MGVLTQVIYVSIWNIKSTDHHNGCQEVEVDHLSLLDE